MFSFHRPSHIVFSHHILKKLPKFINNYMEKATEEVPSIMKDGELKTLITASVKTLKHQKMKHQNSSTAISKKLQKKSLA